MKIIQESTFEKARKTIEKAEKPIIFTSEDDELNRKVLEKLPIDILLINQTNKKDFSKQRNSGFNQVLAKIAKQNNIALGINLDELLKTTGKEKSEILARIKQNIEICKKNKLKIKFISPSNISRNAYDLKALGSVLGMPTWMTKEL